jgi:gephyrin
VRRVYISDSGRNPTCASHPSTMSQNPRLRAAILIISETASKDHTTDKGIPAIQEVFATHGGDKWTAEETRIVPDNVLDIQRTITRWTDGEDYYNLVVTSGGTGFTTKDVTPEVSSPSTFCASRRLSMLTTSRQ